MRTRQQILAQCQAFPAGTSAFYDAHIAVLPCTVLEVLEEGSGYFVCEGRLRIKVTEARGPYRKGEVMEVTAYHTFPRTHRRLRGFHYRINPWYKWVKGGTSDEGQGDHVRAAPSGGGDDQAL
jgi:hypothetical protein